MSEPRAELPHRLIRRGWTPVAWEPRLSLASGAVWAVASRSPRVASQLVSPAAKPEEVAAPVSQPVADSRPRAVVASQSRPVVWPLVAAATQRAVAVLGARLPAADSQAPVRVSPPVAAAMRCAAPGSRSVSTVSAAAAAAQEVVAAQRALPALEQASLPARVLVLLAPA